MRLVELTLDQVNPDTPWVSTKLELTLDFSEDL